jgi:hypothetical protein
MSQEKQTQLSSEPSVAALQGFWQNNRKWLMIAGSMKPI